MVCALTAALCVLALLAVVAVGCSRWFGQREGFTPHLQKKAARVVKFFQETSQPTYSEYKVAIEGADPVQYHDIRGLFEAGEGSPAAIMRAL